MTLVKRAKTPSFGEKNQFKIILFYEIPKLSTSSGISIFVKKRKM